jgi:ParB-like chromosome segregation protein Spo0J
LPESLDRSQEAMIDYIAASTSIEELMEAIAENDFFPGEPLIVVPVEKGSDQYYVLEGNRRLTTVKLLNDPKECSNPGERMHNISTVARYKPKELPVVIRESRSEVLPYLGFRHITGVKQWEPLVKARYIEQLFDLSNRAYPVVTLFK